MKGQGPQSAWTDARRERVKSLWQEGYTATEISKMVAEGTFRPTRSAIIGLTHRAGLTGKGGHPKSNRASKPTLPKRRPERAPAAREWSPDEEAIVEAAFERGETSERMAVLLAKAGFDRTSSAITGKLKNMGLTRPASTRVEGNRVLALIQRGAPKQATPPPPPPKVTVGEGVSLMALEAGQCKWPIGERDGEAVFCGRPVMGSRKPYCAGCAEGSTVPRELRRLREPFDPYSVNRAALPKRGGPYGA